MEEFEGWVRSGEVVRLYEEAERAALEERERRETYYDTVGMEYVYPYVHYWLREVRDWSPKCMWEVMNLPRCYPRYGFMVSVALNKAMWLVHELSFRRGAREPR